jgi:hypothetical protein
VGSYRRDRRWSRAMSERVGTRIMISLFWDDKQSRSASASAYDR